MIRRLGVFVALAMAVVACSPEEAAEPTTTTTTAPPPTTQTTLAPLPPLSVTSPAFEDGQTIPARYTCDGPDVNPPLEIVGLPDETVSIAIIVDDPDAPVGVWDHWVEYDIEASRGEFSIEAAAGQIGTQGVNSWNLPGYGGPCPPEGEEHRYFFTVVVLDDLLGLPPGIDAEGLRVVMEGSIIAETNLIGRYAR